MASPEPLPAAHGEPPARGRIRATPEDFCVEERLGFEPDGRGAHALLTVEKRGANSAWVASQLARAAGVAVRDVGYCGQKDRHAVTRQAYTVPIAAEAAVEEWLGCVGEGYRVVAASRHGRKLRLGAHRSNRFVIVVRELRADRAALEARLQAIGRDGVPNYFGPQRFGRDGANLEIARAWAGGAPGPRERGRRGFVLSAARSHLFNRVLAERVRRADWNRILPGEAVILDGRRSFFAAPVVDAELVDRCAAMDVHPSGPLPGRGASPATGAALACEQAALGSESAMIELLAGQGLEQERRSLRLPLREFGWTTGDDSLRLEFTLPRGAFATAVLHELLADAWDPAETDEG